MIPLISEIASKKEHLLEVFCLLEERSKTSIKFLNVLRLSVFVLLEFVVGLWLCI